MSSSIYQSHYDILSISNPSTCTLDEIRQSFFKLAKLYHPDKVTQQQAQTEREENERKYLSIQQAYHVLSNKNSRETYDQTLQGNTLLAHRNKYKRKTI